MKAVKWSLAGLASLLVFFSFWPRGEKAIPLPVRRSTVALPKAQQTSLLSYAAARHNGASDAAPQTTAARPAVSGETRPADAKASPRVAFADWVERYFNEAWSGDAAALMAEGEQLARARRAELAVEIEENPRAALEHAVPYRWRQVLPANITRYFETSVSGLAQYDVYQASPAPGADYKLFKTPTYRYATVQGRTYRAYVYGMRLAQMSLKNVPLHGIAIDDAMAVDEDPVRVLDADEAKAVTASGAATAGACAVCGAASAAGEVVDVAGNYLTVCSDAHAKTLSRALMGLANRPALAASVLPVWTNPPPVAPLPTFGVRKALYLRINFRDDTTIPISEAQALAEMEEVSRFYTEASYNKTAIITTVTPLLTLPNPKARYSKDGPGAVMADALAEAAKAGYLQANYDLLLARFTPVPGFNWGGLGGGKNAWLQYNGSGLAIHEIGHCYGLGHANYWETRRAPLPNPPPDLWDTDSVIGHDSIIGAGDDIEYGDPFDVMGSGGGESQRTNTQTVSGFSGHFNAIGKNILGWLPDSVIGSDSENRTNRIYVFDTPVMSSNRFYALKIPKDNQRTYWVSARSKITDNHWITNGVSLHWSAWPQAIGYSTLLDTTPGTKDGKNDSPICVGRTYTDPEVNLTITPVAIGGSGTETYYDVVVNRGPFTSNLPPDVTLTASVEAVATNKPVTFTVAAVDPNGDALSYYWDISDGSFGTNGPTLTKTWTQAGDYRVRVEVSDMRGAVVSKHLVVRVGTPTAFRISGVVNDTSGAPLANVRIGNGALTNNTDLADDFQATFTDSDGRFTLINQSTGDHEITAFRHGYLTTPLNFNAIVTVADRDLEGLEFLAQEQPRVTVQVTKDVDLAKGTPGTFTFTRTGDTNTALRAVFILGGTVSTNDYLAYTNTTTHTNALTTLLGPVTLKVPFDFVDFPTGVFQTNITITPTTNAPKTDLHYLSASVMYALQRETTFMTNLDDGSGNLTNGLATNFTMMTGWEVLTPNGSETWFQTYGDYVVGTPGQARMSFKITPPTQPTISILAISKAVSENGGDSALFMLLRSGKMDVPVTVRLAYSGTATYDADYAPLPSIIVIPAGVAAVPLPLYVRPDLYLEGNESVSVTVLADPAYTLGTAKATLTIGDNGLPTLTLMAEDPIASETGTDTGSVVFTRTGDLSRSLTVNYLVGGTAVSGQDYRALSGAITIPAGQPSAALVIQPRDNRIRDGGNTVDIILSDSPTYNAGSPSVATVFIQDGAVPTVTLRATQANAAEPSTIGEFTLSRIGDARQELTVELAVGGTARPVADYAPITTAGVIPAGATSVVIRVSPVNDKIREDDETVICEVLPSTNYNVGSPMQDTVTIADDDSGTLPGVGFTFQNSTFSEGVKTALVAVAVSANPAQDTDVTVDWKVTGGTAVPGVDYPATNTTGRLVFTNVPDPAVSNRVQLIAFPMIDDTNARPDRTVVLTLVEPAPLISNVVTTNEITLTNASGDTIGTTNVLVTNTTVTPIPMNAMFDVYRSHTLTIVDNDSSVVSLETTDPIAMEQGRKQGLFTIRRVGATNQDQVVKLAVSGTAANGSDYETIPDTVVIPEGEASLAVPVIPIDDPIQEFMESVQLSLIAAPGATLSTNSQGTVTIIDNDGTVEFSTPSYAVYESAGQAQITVRRTSDTNVTASVAFQVAAGTATTNDFVPTNGVVTFAPGETLQTFSVSLIDNRVVQPDRTVLLTLRNLSDGVPLGGQTTATLTILDDDTVVELLAPTVRALESDPTASVTLSRYGIITNQLQVDVVATTNGTAVDALDFVATNYTVVFAPGQTSAVAQIKLLDDVLFDGDKTVTLTLTNLDASATFGSNTNGQVLVLDDECSLQFAVSAYQVDEYARTVTLTVQRDGSPVQPVQVDFATSDGTATSGKKYVGARGTLDFAGDQIVRTQDGTGLLVLQPGQTNQSFNIRILDNTIGDGDQVFYLTLTNARTVGGVGLPLTATLGTNTAAAVTIIDNEKPGSVDFEFNPGTGANDTVLTVALQADAKVLLGGKFTALDEVSLNHIARIHDDGYLDTFLNPGGGFDADVLAVALQPDGRIVVGGQFTKFSTNSLNRIARLNADASVDPDFMIGTGADGTVRALAVESGGTILLGGDFNNVQGQRHQRLARLQSAGAVDPTFTAAFDGAVNALAVQSDGKILVGGAFRNVGNVSRPFLARLNADGTLDAGFSPTLDNTVNAIALQADGRVIIAGALQLAGGAPRHGVARLNADGSLDSSFDPGTGVNATVYAAGLTADGKVLLGGAFTQYDGQDRNRLVRLNPDGTLDTTFDIGSGANDTVYTLLVQPDSAVVIGGDFTMVNKLPRNRIARIHGDEKFRLNILQLSSAAYRVSELDGQATIAVNRAGDLTLPATVHFLTADGTAVAGVNYVATNGTLNFAAGETEKTFDIPVLNDNQGRGDLTVNVMLTNLPPGYSLTARLSAVLTIEDSQSAVAFVSATNSVSESAGQADILVRRTGPTNTLVSVDYATADGTGVVGVDYEPATGTLTFNPGERELTFPVKIIDNAVAQSDRTVLLSLTNPQGGAVLGLQNTATLTIVDDDRVDSYALNITPPVGGTVTPSSGSYPVGSTQTVTALPERGFAFTGWQGTVNSTANPLVLVMDKDYVLTAQFAPTAYTYTFEPPFTAANLQAPPWGNNSSRPWQLQSSVASAGKFAVRSGSIGDGQDTSLQLQVNSRGGSAAFDVRVSSEANWDFAEFYVDGLRIERWSGEVGWRTYLFNLGAGTHTLTWRYVKDNNFSAGLDAMFIDNIYVPTDVPDPTDPAAHLTLVGVPDGLQIWVTGKTGLTYTLQDSADLATWSPVASQLNTGGTMVFTVPLDAGTPTKFYRAVTSP